MQVLLLKIKVPYFLISIIQKECVSQTLYILVRLAIEYLIKFIDFFTAKQMQILNDFSLGLFHHAILSQACIGLLEKTLQRLPTAMLYAGILPATMLSVPITELLPIFASGNINTFHPIQISSPIWMSP